MHGRARYHDVIAVGLEVEVPNVGLDGRGPALEVAAATRSRARVQHRPAQVHQVDLEVGDLSEQPHSA